MHIIFFVLNPQYFLFIPQMVAWSTNLNMIFTFAPLKTFLKQKRRVENFVFLLHSRVTVIILIACSLVLTTTQLTGEPISCCNGASYPVPERVINNYCWITSTLTAVGLERRRVGVDAVAPGVGHQLNEKKQHKYYQYVCFILFIQAVFFYTPRYIWKMREGNILESLCRTLTSFIDEKRETSINSLHQYFMTKHASRNEYVLVYILCETLNLANVIGQIWFTNIFLGGVFNDYGLSAIKYLLDPTDYNPMDYIFPKLAMCTFYTYGPSGSIQNFDSLCVLGLNIFNEKIFIFLWCWYIILMVLSSLQLVYRLFSLCSKKCRFLILKRISFANSGQIRTIVDYFDFGTFFLLSNVGKHADPLVFRALLKKLASTIDELDKPVLTKGDFTFWDFGNSSQRRTQKELI